MKTPQAFYEPRSTAQPVRQRTVRRVRYVQVLGVLLGVACVLAVASSAYATSTIVYVVCTCDVRNAGTDDRVEMTHSNGGVTPWQTLDHPGIDNNERGVCYRHTYHNQPDVDPDYIKLRIRGTDGWCVNWIEAWRLLVWPPTSAGPPSNRPALVLRQLVGRRLAG